MALPTALDLTKAKNEGFKAVEAGKYQAKIFSVEACETGPNAKMGAGAPGINVCFIAKDGQTDSKGAKLDNRRFWKRFYIAPDDYENKQVMDNMFYGFCNLALPESVVKNPKGFNLAKAVDDEDFNGAEVTLSVVKSEVKVDGQVETEEVEVDGKKIEQPVYRNEVKSVAKPRTTGSRLPK